MSVELQLDALEARLRELYPAVRTARRHNSPAWRALYGELVRARQDWDRLLDLAIATSERDEALVALAALREQLTLVSEFRVPLPDNGVGGYGEVVVKRQQDGPGDRWAVTDGADTGLRAWVDGEGWRHVTDIGRAAAFRHTREEALLLARQVAEIEATCYGAEIDALGMEDQDGEQQ